MRQENPPPHNATQEDYLDFCPVAKDGSGHFVGRPNSERNTFALRSDIFHRSQGSKEHISGETE